MRENNEGVIYYTIVKEEDRKKRLEHMIGEKLLETGLAREYGKDLRFEPRGKGEFGKPFFTLAPDIHYNISHSGKYVMCILCGEPVGIDVQEHRNVKYEMLLRRMVPEPMIREILEGGNTEEEFFTQWVLREAYIKWTGEGFSHDIRTISMDEGSSCLLEVDEGYSAAVWSMDPLNLRMEYVEAEIR